MSCPSELPVTPRARNVTISGMASRLWWLYLLACADGRTYAGIALDVEARFSAHADGKGAKFTRSNPPLRVLGARSFATKSEAMKAEIALKKLARPQRLAWAREWRYRKAPRLKAVGRRLKVGVRPRAVL